MLIIRPRFPAGNVRNFVDTDMEPLQPGDRLDGFLIENSLYEGAMARIYRARDLLTDEVVALKVPFGDIINTPILFYHYQNEERIGRLLNHPHVVRFFHRNRSRQYIIQEYVPGSDLRKSMGRNRKLEFSQACAIVLQIADALTYLHGCGVIHLDLKPENIILFKGRIKLIDFGLAVKSTLPDLLAEDFSSPHGTPFYIAPEQIAGIRSEPRSDIYSLGVILYEMLTGELPFPRSTKLSDTRLRLKSDPVPPRYYEPELDPKIQEILLKALAVKPEDRYESAARLSYDLEHLEKVRVTERGKRTKKPFWFLARFKPAVSFSPRPSSFSTSDKPQLLGAVIDDDSADNVVEALRRRVLMLGAEVTLLTVLEEEDDSHFLKYGREVAGEQLRNRLEHFVQRFRRYNIDPTIRLIRGNASEVICTVARQLHAVCVVLGPSRKPGLFGSSVVKKVITKLETEVLIAETTPHTLVWTMQDIAIDRLSEEQVIAIDIFLVDGWFNHVSWLADLALSLLLDSGTEVELDSGHCLIGKWLSELRRDPYWQRVARHLDPIHTELHEVAKKMIRLAKRGDLVAMKNTYRYSALPLSCTLREKFAKVSRLIREWSGHYELQQIPALLSEKCPLFDKEAPVGGPLLELHMIRHYLEGRAEDGPKPHPMDSVKHKTEGK